MLPLEEPNLTETPTVLYFIYSRLSLSQIPKERTETLRDIRTSTYQSWESEEDNKLNNHIKQMNM